MKGWSGLPTKKFVASSKEFGELLRKQISFYDLDAHIEDITSSVKKDIAGSKKVKFATLEALDEVDDFPEFYSDSDEGEYVGSEY